MFEVFNYGTTGNGVFVSALPLESAAFPTVSWSHLVVALPALSRKVRLALPCIGSASSIDDQSWTSRAKVENS